MRLDLTRVRRPVEKPELDRTGPPYIVEVQIVIPITVVVFRMQVFPAEPGLIQRRVRQVLGGVQPVDESRVGPGRVVRQPVFPSSGAFRISSSCLKKIFARFATCAALKSRAPM